ncbi:MAG: hypothetical protein ABJD86_01935 [Pyruvatibacter sp.]|uniref:hypothetical protein n=1 Tax=Pyruvatibacter sp. TaxID=1981328 RepID=UPI003265F6C1
MHFWRDDPFAIAKVCALAAGLLVFTLPAAAIEGDEERVVPFGSHIEIDTDVLSDTRFKTSVGGSLRNSQSQLISVGVVRAAEFAHARGHSHFVLSDLDSEILCHMRGTAISRPQLDMSFRAGTRDSFTDEAVVYSVAKVKSTLAPAIVVADVTGQDGNTNVRENQKNCERRYIGRFAQPWHLYNILEDQTLSANSPVSVDEALTAEVMSNGMIAIAAKTTGFSLSERLLQLAMIRGAEMAAEQGSAYLGVEAFETDLACASQGLGVGVEVTLQPVSTLADIPDGKTALSVDKIINIMRPVVAQNAPNEKMRRWMYTQNGIYCADRGAQRSWREPWKTYNILAERS